jgi:hypothetical protein
MPDTQAKGIGETLQRKVGPLPLWAWLGIGGGLWWYFQKKQAGSGAQTPAAAQSTTGYGTDPAGNVGYIDPQTGYVYGSAEDIAALQNQGLVGANQYTGGTGVSGVGSTADTSGQTTGVTTPSGTSVTTPPSTTPPPSIPSPGAAAPRSTNWQYPAPTGLQAYDVSSAGTRLRWNPVQGPQGQKPATYTIATYQGSTKVNQFTAGNTGTSEYGPGGKGLKPSTTYVSNVWANGGPVAPPHASVSWTTKKKGG